MLELSTAARNALLDSLSTTVGAGGTLPIRTGAPAGIGNSDTGTLLATLTSVTFASASGGQKTFSATADSSGDASGTPGHFRILTSGATVVFEGTAGVGTGATAGTPTVAGGAITVAPVSDGGSGYGATTPLPCTVIGGGGSGAIITATVAGGVVTGLNIVTGGINYSSAPTILIPPPFDLCFNTTISLGGNVSLSSATLTAGNA